MRGRRGIFPWPHSTPTPIDAARPTTNPSPTTQFPAQPPPVEHRPLNSAPADQPPGISRSPSIIPRPSRSSAPPLYSYHYHRVRRPPHTASSGALPPQRSCRPSLSDAAQPSPPKLRRLPRIITDINLMTISTTFLILKLYLSYTEAVLKVSSSCVLCLLPLFPHSLPSATINIKDSARRFTCLHSLWQRIHLPSASVDSTYGFFGIKQVRSSIAYIPSAPPPRSLVSPFVPCFPPFNLRTDLFRPNLLGSRCVPTSLPYIHDARLHPRANSLSPGCILVPPFSPFYVRPLRSSGRPNNKPRLQCHLAPYTTSHRRRDDVRPSYLLPFASAFLPPLWLYRLSGLHHVPQLPRGVGQSALDYSSTVYPSSASCFFIFRDYKLPFLRAFFPRIAPPFSYTCARVPAAILLWNVSSDLNIQFSESSTQIPNAVHAQQFRTYVTRRSNIHLGANPPIRPRGTGSLVCRFGEHALSEIPFARALPPPPAPYLRVLRGDAFSSSSAHSTANPPPTQISALSPTPQLPAHPPRYTAAYARQIRTAPSRPAAPFTTMMLYAHLFLYPSFPSSSILLLMLHDDSNLRLVAQ
ncbi:hypothetical protein B0H19DRAFT_1263762 [Mycena capillaripes]|nr:hypothetical protein B0H19DRAFT_1263762 [Mycena capillaripes]